MSYNSINKNNKAIDNINSAISEFEKAYNIIKTENDNENSRVILELINSEIEDLKLAKSRISSVNNSISYALKKKEEKLKKEQEDINNPSSSTQRKWRTGKY